MCGVWRQQKKVNFFGTGLKYAITLLLTFMPWSMVERKKANTLLYNS